MIIQEQSQEICFQIDYKVLEKKGIVIVGLSPENSYFKKETIHELLSFLTNLFSMLRIMIPDKPILHTYKALGYSIQKAERKARLNGNTLKNHCNNSINEILKIQSNKDIKIINWELEIESEENYLHELKALFALYQSKTLFYEDVRSTKWQVIKKNMKDHSDIEKSLDEAVIYLLKELAFILASPLMFKVENIAFVYHTNWPPFENLIAGKYDGKIRKNIGFLICVKK